MNDSANHLARCNDVFGWIECNTPGHYGNVFTAYNGSIGQGGVVEIKYALLVDHGDFALTQRPGLAGEAPVPEPATLLLVVAGIAGAARRIARRTDAAHRPN